MLLSDEIGSWAGDITKAKLPDQFLVDYVRVYDPKRSLKSEKGRWSRKRSCQEAGARQETGILD